MAILTFTDPGNLWFAFSIPLLIIIHFYTLRFSRKKAIKFANYEAIERISGGVVLTKNITLLVLRLIILVCFILAASGAILNYTGQGTDQKFVLAIDSSSSMTATDMAPSRLDSAKTAAKIFVDEIGSKTRVGVLSFAGSSVILQALTDNMDNVLSSIDNINILAIGGTDIGEAMITGVNMFNSNEADMEGGRSIIILTDGRSNVGVSVDKAILYCNEANIMVHTIGVGTKEGGILQGTTVTLTLDEESLQNIAQSTGGAYYRAETNDQLIEAYKKIANISETKVSIHLSKSLLTIALFLLLLEWCLINTRYRTLP